MAVSPPLNPILMALDGNGTLQGRDRSGLFSAVGSGALRYAPAPGARINQAINARFATDATGWQAAAAGMSMNRVADARFAGGWAIEAACDGSVPFQGIQQSMTALRPEFEPNTTPSTITVSFDLLVVSGAKTVYLAINTYTLDGVFVGSGIVRQAFPAATDFDVVQRVSLTANVNANWSNSTLHRLVVHTNTPGAASTFRIANIVLETGSVPNATYFEGPWLIPRTGQLGTPHASPSVEHATFWEEESTTNLFPAGSFENATLIGVSGVSAPTLTKDTTRAYLGAASMKVVTSGAIAGEGVRINTASSLGDTGTAGPFTGQCLVSGAGTVNVWTRIEYTDVSTTESAMVPVTLTGEWQKVVPPTITNDPAKVVNAVYLYVSTPTAAAITFYVDCVQMERKAGATSFATGDMGAGYSWAGTAHASPSVRAAMALSLPSANHLLLATGEIVARYRGDMPADASNHRLTFWNYNGSDARIYLTNYNNGSTKMGAGLGNSSVLIVDTVALGIGTWVTGGVAWAAGVGRLYKNGVQVGSSASYTGMSSLGATIYIGSNSGTLQHLDGLIGPVLIYDAPLSDARRAIVNAAIDSNGAIDLWSLFEEWEAVGLPLESVALQAGQATAGVRAVALPMETSVLQDGRATAGVRAVAQPMEGAERQGGKALAFDGARLIPVPDTRSVIVIGES